MKAPRDIHMAVTVTIPAWPKMQGTAMLPTRAIPVKNFAKSSQSPPPPPFRMKSVPSSPPPTNAQGTSGYTITAIIGHQLLYKTHANSCSKIPTEKRKASPASLGMHH
eukprot:TRINITY_DN632_c0_g1_i2.p1 TRINITY_DN632_c0_g1~~TRINITY_DN632_c0_g1_i2.p1  ORF type:complete len:108 (+),score=16.10 TRINITY_DN632_c0_g1_i2:456-779(+)